MLYCGQTELSLPAVNCAPAGREVDVELTVDEADGVEEELGPITLTRIAPDTSPWIASPTSDFRKQEFALRRVSSAILCWTLERMSRCRNELTVM